MSETFGQYIARRRKAVGLTQAEVARRISVTPTYISHLERGIDPTGRSDMLLPTVEVVDAIAKAINAPVAKVRRLAGHAPPEDVIHEVIDENVFDKGDFDALYFKYEKLTAKQKREFKRILEMIDRELDRLQQEAFE
ncbi:MAG TPA: helix-turn-helix transcriptional regulator [Pyrinomonadaceae bacterium]|nr:helix-turn-helix transcriptional regulator [Pyrinomonadaceae bacterium]